MTASGGQSFRHGLDVGMIPTAGSLLALSDECCSGVGILAEHGVGVVPAHVAVEQHPARSPRRRIAGWWLVIRSGFHVDRADLREIEQSAAREKQARSRGFLSPGKKGEQTDFYFGYETPHGSGPPPSSLL